MPTLHRSSGDRSLSPTTSRLILGNSLSPFGLPFISFRPHVLTLLCMIVEDRQMQGAQNAHMISTHLGKKLKWHVSIHSFSHTTTPTPKCFMPFPSVKKKWYVLRAHLPLIFMGPYKSNRYVRECRLGSSAFLLQMVAWPPGVRG